MIHFVAAHDGWPDSYVISSHHVWIPGSYETKRAAYYAFQFNPQEQAELRDRINVGEKRNITLDDLKKARKK